MVKLLMEFNCTSMNLVLCDYFSLKHVIAEIILKKMLEYSTNYLQKRKIKDVTHIIVDEK